MNLVAGAMKEAGIPPDKLRAVLEALNAELAAAEKDPKPPAPKKQFVILVSDPLGHLVGKDFAGWVCMIVESEHPATLVERIERAAYAFNDSKRGRLMPVQTVGETLETVPAKLLKESGVWAKTRTCVSVVTTKNEIAGTPSILVERVNKEGAQ